MSLLSFAVFRYNRLLIFSFVFPVGVDYFLWEEPEILDRVFPPLGVGKYILPRNNLIKLVMKEIDRQIQVNAPSVYLSGCRGMGNTINLMLLARHLKESGYEVYFFEHPGYISIDITMTFEEMMKDKTKKFAVLINEVDKDPYNAVFTTLLKATSSNVVTIGAAVPHRMPNNRFRKRFGSSYLVLKKDDDDVQELIQYWTKLNVTTPAMTKVICEFILEYCGGHVYPCLAFMKYFLYVDNKSDAQKSILESESEFRKYFLSRDFANSEVCKHVINRCYYLLYGTPFAYRILGGSAHPRDIDSLTNMGWWDYDKNDFISSWLVNSCLNFEKPAKVDLQSVDSQDDNTELVIAKALSAMRESDFHCNEFTSEVDSLAFNWAMKARWIVPHEFLSFQERHSESGRVNIRLNADCAIVILLNATQSAEKKETNIHPSFERHTRLHDIDEHFDRLFSGNHPWKRFVLLNFAMKRNEVVLPRVDPAKHADVDIHSRVYTYVWSSNVLYRGNTPIEAPAVVSLSMLQKRKYSTLSSP